MPRCSGDLSIRSNTFVNFFGGEAIPREWINAHGNDIRQELYNYLYPLIQGEVCLTYQNGVPVYMPVPHLKPDHVS